MTMTTIIIVIKIIIMTHGEKCQWNIRNSYLSIIEVTITSAAIECDTSTK